ncbi:MAG: ATP-dependent RNA helicase HrpA [Desulfobacterales bacterium]|nr:ATP-dependent RNA helicase HrpA [Desulfobacterales bacterium]
MKRNLEKKRLQISIQKRKWRKDHLPKPAFNTALPIFSHKEKIVDSISKNRVVIISGETGSGKTTQIPQFFMAAARGINGIIGCTQPRRIAVTTVAHRIAEELGEELGESVGYKIRFKEMTRKESFIKIMTDGILLAETLTDPYLNQYDTIIVDEAHERSLNIDLILGILKILIKRRKDLKLIITSATIDTTKFSAAFDHAPIIEVSGRVYPIKIRYLPSDKQQEDTGEPNHVEMAVFTMEKLHKKSPKGDVLVFMPTEQDIRDTCELIESRDLEKVMVLPLYARLSGSEQKNVFLRSLGRKIIVATNVAETSITIPGIRYVIDTGLARIPQYSPASRITSLPVLPISRSSADQRKGRCGRVENGICIRLFSQDDYDTRPVFTLPEILRANLAEVILKMIALKLDDIDHFSFIDRPVKKSIKDGYDLLVELGAIETKHRRKHFSLTDKGKLMTKIPLDPRLSRILIQAIKEKCLKETSVITSALSLQDPRERPVGKTTEAEQSQSVFIDSSSDFITLLNIWNGYQRAWQRVKSMNKMKKFCKDHYLSFKRMREWRDIHTQILAILKESGILDGEFKIKTVSDPEYRISKPVFERIHRSILSGFLSNIAMKKEKNIYTAAKGREVMIFPGSGLFNGAGQWIVSAEMIKTSRLFARTVANIDSGWLEILGKGQCKYTYHQPHWDKNKGEVIVFEQANLYGLIIVSKRTVSFGPIDPDRASDIFIRSALVMGEIKKTFSFITRNNALINNIKEMENRIRRRDLLVSEDELALFYKNRLSGVFDLKGLERLIQEKGADRFLLMKKEDLLLYTPDDKEIALYPDSISFGNYQFPLTYCFNPREENDGVTVNIPSSVATTTPVAETDWLVPGLLKEKITLLIKRLPKQYRKHLAPVTQTVDTILNEIPKGKTTLITALGKFIYKRFNLSIPGSAWPSTSLPDHLKMRMSVKGPKGEEIFSGRDLYLLYQQIPAKTDPKESIEFASAINSVERTGITSFDFENLPETITLKGKNGTNWVAYPGLEKGEGDIDQSCGANFRLFHHRGEAVKSHKEGVAALFCIALSKELKFLKKILITPKKWADHTQHFGGVKQLENQMFQKVVHDLFHKNIRRKNEFKTWTKSASPLLLTKGRELLNSVLSVVAAYHEARSKLYQLEIANRSNSYTVSFFSSLREDLSQLVPEIFIQLYDSDRLNHMVRYIRAITIRAERGSVSLEKDQTRGEDVKVFSDRLANLLETLSPSVSKEKRRAIEDFFWLIQEYKVSIFAQELKTPFPVSKNKLKKKLNEIERMI